MGEEHQLCEPARNTPGRRDRKRRSIDVVAEEYK